jgi:hypothetical protein
MRFYSIANLFYPYNIIYFRQNSEFLREFLISKFSYGFPRGVILSAAALTVFIRSNSHRLYPRQLSPFLSAAALTVFTAAILIVSTDFFAGRHAAIWKIDRFYVKDKL